MNRAVGHRAMTLRAQRGDIRHVQQTGVLRSVRSVASHATLGLHSSVLEHERPAGFCVALGADRILIRGALQVCAVEGSVRIVAIGAARNAFVHLVMERHRELRLLIGVTLVAQVWLGSLQQMLGLLVRVDAVA